jgi:hypothetical protein
MEKLIEILARLARVKFTGKIEITLNQGGIIGMEAYSKTKV